MSYLNHRVTYCQQPPTALASEPSTLKIQLPPIQELTNLPTWKDSEPSICLPPIKSTGLGQPESASAPTASLSQIDRCCYSAASPSSNTGSSKGGLTVVPSDHSRSSAPTANNAMVSTPCRYGYPPEASHISEQPSLLLHRRAPSTHDIKGRLPAGALNTLAAEESRSLRTTESMGLGKYAVSTRKDNSPRQRRCNLPKASTAILSNWFGEHLHQPYPTEDEKVQFQVRTGLTMSQINNWFINARRRRFTNRSGARGKMRVSCNNMPSPSPRNSTEVIARAVERSKYVAAPGPASGFIGAGSTDFTSSQQPGAIPYDEHQ